MDKHETERFDHALTALKGQGLVWLPWVGRDYETSTILVVGESHYCGLKGPRATDRSIKDLQNKREYTREVVREHVSTEGGQGTFDNIERVLVGSRNVSSAAFWPRVAFYNFVQHMMRKDKRPEGTDFQEGWPVFIQVLKVLKPTHCLFAGLTAFNC